MRLSAVMGERMFLHVLDALRKKLPITNSFPALQICDKKLIFILVYQKTCGQHMLEKWVCRQLMSNMLVF